MKLHTPGPRGSIILHSRLADARVPADMPWGQSETQVAELYAEFVKAGRKVAVCPHCAKACGLKGADLPDGAEILTEEGLANLFGGADRILDY